jgi:hypothetical protein
MGRQWARALVLAMAGWFGMSGVAEAGGRAKLGGGRSTPAALAAPGISWMAQPSRVVSSAELPLNAIGGVDVEILGRTYMSFSLAMPDPGLSTLDTTSRLALLRHLEADPRWRVTEEEGIRVALRRREVAGLWTVPADGLHRLDDGAWRADLRSAVWPSSSQWMKGSLVQELVPGGPSGDLSAVAIASGEWRGLFATALRAEGAGVGLDLFEVSTGASRAYTVGALSELNLEISNILAGYDFVEAEGFVSFAMPPGAPAKQASLTLQSTAAGVALRATVPTTTAGWTWARIVHRGAPWQEVLVAQGTRERLGYTADGADFFLMQSVFPAVDLPSGGLVVEVWHLVDGATRPVRLQTVQVAE